MRDRPNRSNRDMEVLGMFDIRNRLVRRVWAAGFAIASTVVLVSMLGAGQPPANRPAANPPAAPQSDIIQASQNSPAVSTQIDPAAQLLAEARASFARVKDYVGTLVKEERVGRQMQPEQFIAIRVREQPFSVHLKWQSPKQFEGQEAVYVAGKNSNKMRAKSSGIVGVVGFVSLDPTDPRAMRQSRHAITETGIGYLIQTLTKAHEAQRRLPPGQVQMSYREFMFQQRKCIGVDIVNKVNDGQMYFGRCVVYFDKEMKLPVRFEAYDWPTPGGTPGGDKLECYSYIDLKFNVGLTDAAFGL